MITLGIVWSVFYFSSGFRSWRLSPSMVAIQRYEDRKKT